MSLRAKLGIIGAHDEGNDDEDVGQTDMENSTTESAIAPLVSADGAKVGPPLRIGLVGCGTVGNVHRERLMPQPVEIVAVCDPDADALARMAERLPRRPRLFRSEQDLLASGAVEAVVLCTPHARHAAQVRAALNANVHVLCEKPFVTNLSEAQELIALAQSRNRALWVSYTRRSRGHARFLQQAIRQIQPLRNIVILRTQAWVQRHERTWRMRTGEGGGFLLDNGASLLDMLLRMVHAPVTDIRAHLARQGGGEIDTGAQIHLAFANGAQAAVTLLGDSTEEVEEIRFFGDGGTAGWSLREGAEYDLYMRSAETGISERGDAARYRVPLPDAAFVRAIRGGADFSANADTTIFEGVDRHDAQTTLPVVALLDRIYRVAVWE